MLLLVVVMLCVDALAWGGVGDVSADPGTVPVSGSVPVSGGTPVPQETPITLVRAGSPYTLTVRSQTGGEGLLDVTAEAPGIDWATRDDESAVVAVDVDGRLATDIVVWSQHPIARRVQLGYLPAGVHTLTLAVDGEASVAAARTVVLRGPAVAVVPPGAAASRALATAPVLYGRSLPDLGGRFQNNHTDTPLLAWHTEDAVAARPGHTLFEYSVMWSNEDGGTGNDPAVVQARWGRQTDIEWVYRVEVDAEGSTVAGTAVYQGPNHVVVPFRGSYEHGHPVLQTCTSNNNVCDVLVDPGMRFMPAADREPVAGQARERMMDANPWAYQVSAAEVRREGKTEPVASPDTPALSDPRNYLYIVVRKTTAGPAVSPAEVSAGLAGGNLGWVGTAVGVRLRRTPGVLYRSDHAIAGWTLQRDGSAATAVELPVGTRLDDIATVEVLRVPTTMIDPGSTVTVTGVERAIMLGDDSLPAAGSLTWSGMVTLTAASPVAVLYEGIPASVVR